MAVEFEKKWNVSQEIITKLTRHWEKDDPTQKEISAEDYMTVYTTVYDLCGLAKQCPQYPTHIYDRYKQTFHGYISSTVIPSLRCMMGGEPLLKEVVRRWRIYKIMVKWLSRMFRYLDPYYLPGNVPTTLKEVAFACFRDQAYQEHFKTKAVNAIIALARPTLSFDHDFNSKSEIDVERERKGIQMIKRDFVKEVIDVYTDMQVYESDFETVILQDTIKYYSQKAAEWIEDGSFCDYMLKVELSLKKEKDRISMYLHPYSEEKLLKTVKNELLVKYCNKLLENRNSWCDELLINNKVEDLSRMYTLFQEIPDGLMKMANILKQHVDSQCKTWMKETEDAMASKLAIERTPQILKLVGNVIELHTKLFGHVAVCFANKSQFVEALKEAFDTLCNTTISTASSAEFLALYCDDIIKKGRAGRLLDEAIEETFNKVAQLISYIRDKDVFVEFCRKRLACRLLLEKSYIEHEMLMITKLKPICSSLSNMKRMMIDMEKARENEVEFHKFCPNLGMDFSVSVLTTGFWPSYKCCDIVLPPEMVNCVEKYKEFFQRITGRSKSLTWIYSLGICIINATFQHKTIELTMTTPQAVILLLFNEADKLSYSDIKGQLNLEDDEMLIRLLTSLSCGCYKILNKNPDNKFVSKKDHFQFNDNFTHTMARLKVPILHVVQRKRTVKDAEINRRYTVDAAIVHIMKRRKVLDGQQLLKECNAQLSHAFEVNEREIKMRIEDLIVREYIERDRKNPNTFRYLAG